MTDDVSGPPVRNKFSELAFRATMINLVSWLLLATPGFLQSIWSISLMVTIPLSTIIALIAGTVGEASLEKLCWNFRRRAQLDNDRHQSYRNLRNGKCSLMARYHHKL